MPVQFLNGGPPSYEGVPFDTPAQARELLVNLLLSVGWTIQSGSLGALPVVLRSGAAVEDYYGFIQINDHTDFLLWQGRLGSAVGALSTSYGVSYGLNNRLYAFADEYRFAVWIDCTSRISTASAQVCYFGWADPILDKFGIFTGQVRARTQTSGVALQVITSNGASWALLTNNTQPSSNVLLSTSLSAVSPINPVTGRPEIFPFFMTQNNNEFRGFLSRIYTGVAGLPTGTLLEYQDKLLLCDTYQTANAIYNTAFQIAEFSTGA